MGSPCRLYLQTADDEFRRLLWVHNHKPNEMLLGIYGLSSKVSTLRKEWPARELDKSEVGKVRYEWADAKDVGLEIDHITCHADGSFHIKTRQSGDDLYIQRMGRTEPLGPDTSIFLEFLVYSDVATHYTVVQGKPKPPHVWFRPPQDHYMRLSGRFAGANFRIKPTKPLDHVWLTSGTLQGLVLGQPGRISGEALANRPPGTLVSFKFPVAGEKWHIKQFLFD